MVSRERRDSYFSSSFKIIGIGGSIAKNLGRGGNHLPSVDVLQKMSPVEAVSLSVFNYTLKITILVNQGKEETHTFPLVSKSSESEAL